jgi:hypothetical protein
VTALTIPELADLVRAGCDADVEVAPTIHEKLCEKVLYGDPCGDAPCDCGRPARVLAEVASKRALLDEVLNWGHDSLCHWMRPVRPGMCTCGRDERVRTVLTLLAQPYQPSKEEHP